MKQKSEPLRLSKRMVELGMCSRRQADEWIARGWVKVNGKTITTMGQKVLPSDEIELIEEARKTKTKFKTIILNKPVGYVSAQPELDYPAAVTLLTIENYEGPEELRPFEDPFQSGRPIDFQLTKWRVAGRLDIDSRGLLIFTQDPVVVSRIISPDTKVEKEYVVRMDGKPDPAELEKFLTGKGEIEGKKLKPARIFQSQKPQFWHFCLQEGKKRQIRKMAEVMGCKVHFLMRVRLGDLKLGALSEGKWRYLSEQEVQGLIS